MAAGLGVEHRAPTLPRCHAELVAPNGTEFAERVAIVTGASSGIGAATAVELARHGARVVGVARRAGQLAEVIAECQRHSPASIASVHDVSDRADAEHAVTDALERFGRVDVVVNNAGISVRKPAAECTPDDIERVMAVNFFGAVYVSLRALPSMLDRRSGSIVNITSVAGYIPNPLESAYGASKAALSMWSHGLAVDLHDSGVHVGVLSPGPIDTEIWGKDEIPSPYEGKLYPPKVVADGVVSMIRHHRTHMTVPRQFGAVGAVYPLLGRPLRWGLRQFEARAARRTASSRSLP
jgi:NAD(P)-dependent dehydrogenase (short-subunit alcohol dehydrogenase family)